MASCSRRDFLKNGLVAAAVAGTGRLPLRVSPGTPADWVTLGSSGVEVTRLAFGTGTEGGRVQRELGQAQFTRLVRHAYDRGIRFFDTAGPGKVAEVTQHARRVHDEGMGVIGMKLVGNGTFTTREERRAAIRYAFRNAGVDCVTVGYKSTAEIDEAIENVTEALA